MTLKNRSVYDRILWVNLPDEVICDGGFLWQKNALKLTINLYGKC